MEDKLNVDYTITKVGKEVDYLYDNHKVKEVFVLAETGAIAVIEELNGQKYIVLKEEKFQEVINSIASKRNITVNFNGQ